MTKSSARTAAAKTFIVLFMLVAAAGAQTFSTIASLFANGNVYTTPLVDKSGNVFGTSGSPGDCGAVYELVKNPGSNYCENNLYKFTCGDDGGFPNGGVAMDSVGNLYGTTYEWGPNGFGVVYELANNGGGSYTFEVLHAFSKGSGGTHPIGDLVLFKGSLYGVTYDGGVNGCNNGGNHGCGTVYRLSKSGSKWIETVLHEFKLNNPNDGKYPFAGVTLDSEGNIYGTTYGGGMQRNGTIFRLSSGSYKETVLRELNGAGNGCRIESGVVLDSAGNLYGTASYCGANNEGTVYQLKHSGSNYGFKVILQFNGPNGVFPYERSGHLAVDSAGNVYGTAYEGGAQQFGFGTVFKLAAGSFLYTDLYNFLSKGLDGDAPKGGVSFDSRGNLYGTTFQGGVYGQGTVWRIANP